MGHVVDLVSRATVRGWLLASWSVLGFKMQTTDGSLLGDLDTFGNTREIHYGEHYSAKALC